MLYIAREIYYLLIIIYCYTVQIKQTRHSYSITFDCCNLICIRTFEYLFIFASKFVTHAYFCRMALDVHTRVQAYAPRTKPTKAAWRRIEFSCLVGKRRRPPAILFENIPRDQSRDERRFCCSNGFVNKIGKEEGEVGRDRQRISSTHCYIFPYGTLSKRSFFPPLHSYVAQRKRRLMQLDAVRRIVNSASYIVDGIAIGIIATIQSIDINREKIEIGVPLVLSILSLYRFFADIVICG